MNKEVLLTIHRADHSNLELRFALEEFSRYNDETLAMARAMRDGLVAKGWKTDMVLIEMKEVPL